MTCLDPYPSCKSYLTSNKIHLSMMISQEVREIDNNNNNNNNNNNKHLYSAYTEAVCPLHNIHTIVKNKNEKIKFRF